MNLPSFPLLLSSFKGGRRGGERRRNLRFFPLLISPFIGGRRGGEKGGVTLPYFSLPFQPGPAVINIKKEMRREERAERIEAEGRKEEGNERRRKPRTNRDSLNSKQRKELSFVLLLLLLCIFLSSFFLVRSVVVFSLPSSIASATLLSSSTALLSSTPFPPFSLPPSLPTLHPSRFRRQHRGRQGLVTLCP